MRFFTIASFLLVLIISLTNAWWLDDDLNLHHGPDSEETGSEGDWADRFVKKKRRSDDDRPALRCIFGLIRSKRAALRYNDIYNSMDLAVNDIKQVEIDLHKIVTYQQKQLEYKKKLKECLDIKKKTTKRTTTTTTTTTTRPTTTTTTPPTTTTTTTTPPTTTTPTTTTTKPSSTTTTTAKNTTTSTTTTTTKSKGTTHETTHKSFDDYETPKEYDEYDPDSQTTSTPNDPWNWPSSPTKHPTSPTSDPFNWSDEPTSSSTITSSTPSNTTTEETTTKTETKPTKPGETTKSTRRTRTRKTSTTTAPYYANQQQLRHDYSDFLLEEYEN